MKTGSGEMGQSFSSFIQCIGRHLYQRSLYAVGISADILLPPDDSLMISFDGYGDSDIVRTKAVFHRKACIFLELRRICKFCLLLVLVLVLM